MKQNIKINSLLAIVNYPLTFICMIATGGSLFYILELLILLLFKVLISFFGGKIRADLGNPHFHKNRLRLK